jgi:AraC-like DNA-binding protein
MTFNPVYSHTENSFRRADSITADLFSAAPACNHHLAPARAVSPPSLQTTWESLALASNFRPSLLAHRCGVSIRTLQRHFTKHYRITLSESLREMRLRLAYTRLQRGERIKCVAYDLGYKQLSHFSRDFKRFFGIPPSAV